MSDTDDRSWYCLRTQTKREHIAAKHLDLLDGIEVFCPRIRYRKATRRGKIWWMEPLFPGYLLVKFNLAKDERTVCSSQGIRGMIRFGSEFPCVPEKFVANLITEVGKQCEEGESIITVAPSLAIGDEVEVADGPFKGMKGSINTIASGKERVSVLLEFLGGVQPISLDLFSILLPSKPLPKL